MPDLLMLSISDGTHHYVAPPSAAAQLIEATADSQLIFHNCAFDFWVLDQHLQGSAARDLLWAAVDDHRVHDTMLLSGLVTLAENRPDENA